MSTPTDLVLCAASDGPSTTRALAAALADLLADGDLLVLTGDLGAGKTCFTQGVGTGLGIEDRITSPTFTLASEYEGRLRLHHLDVYRLDGPADALDLDLHELAEDGVTVIEWGEQIESALGPDRLVIEIAFLDPDPALALSAAPTGPDADHDSAPDPAAEQPAAPTGPDRPDGEPVPNAAAGVEVPVDDRRRLRFRLVGDEWRRRAESLAAIIDPWTAPC